MFNVVDPKKLDFNPFSEIGERWMLITAGDADKANTMTASWGGAGVLWNKNVVTCYVRPQRYTRGFMDAKEYFSVSFFPEEFRKQLGNIQTGPDDEAFYRETKAGYLAGKYRDEKAEVTNSIAVAEKMGRTDEIERLVARLVELDSLISSTMEDCNA